MERITEKDTFGEYVELSKTKTLYVGAGGFMRGSVIQKLFAYEDTGLEPSEVEELINKPSSQECLKRSNKT